MRDKIKISDISQIVSGYAFDSKLFTDDAQFKPLIRIRDLKKGYTETFYKGDYPEWSIVKKGDYLIGMDGEFSIIEWVGEDALLNQRVCKLIVDSPDFLERYVLWLLPRKLKQIEDETPFVTVKHLSIKKIADIDVPKVSLSDQQHIVEELDTLSGIIEKQKEQLKQLDALAQSIFYDMFGDPITNEKGWETIQLASLCDITSSKRIYASEYCSAGVPFYRGKEITEMSQSKDIENELFISQQKHNELKEKYGTPQKGDILMTAVGTIGNMWIVNTTSPFYYKDGNILCLRIKKDINSIYFKYLLTILVNKYKNTMANGCAYNALTIINLKKMETNITPLELQDLFALKIGKIEQQKKLIKQSIKETEELFNSRMDYYFN